jgi:hypothetical protein
VRSSNSGPLLDRGAGGRSPGYPPIAYRYVWTLHPTLRVARNPGPVRPHGCRSQSASALQHRADGHRRCRKTCRWRRHRARVDALGTRSLLVEQALETAAGDLQCASGERR